jgi:CRP-like cAMP-binding protein
MIDRLLMKLRRFDTISAEEEQALRGAVSKDVRFVRGRTIVRAKTELDVSLLLVEGFVYRFKDLKSGARQALQLAVPGDFIDLHGFVLKQLDHDISSLTDCRLALFPHERLKPLIGEHQHLARVLWLCTVVDAANHREWMLSLGRRSAASRLAHFFCELQVRLTAVGMAEHGSYNLPITQNDLAEILGITSVHINRMLKELREKGLVTFRKKTVEILDWDGMVSVAEFDPFYLSLNQRSR